MRLRGDREPGHLLVRRQREIAAALGVRRAAVGIRPQPQDQLELHQRRLQLASQRPRLDPLGRLQRVLDRPPKPAAGEVRAHAGAQVGRLSHVQHTIVAVVEQVDARPGRHVACQLTPEPHAAAHGGGEGNGVGHRADAVLLGHAEQDHQQLRRGLGVRQRAVTGPHAGVEALRQRAQAHALDAALEQPPGERDRVDDGSGQPPALQPRQLRVHEADVEAGVVRDQHGAAREREELRQCPADARRSPQVTRVDTGDARDRLGHRDARVDQPLQRRLLLEPEQPHGADLDDPRDAGPGAGRLQVEDHERGILERHVLQRGHLLPLGQRQLARAIARSAASRRARPHRRAAGRARREALRAARTGCRPPRSAPTGARRSASRPTSRSAPSSESWAEGVAMRTHVRIYRGRVA